MENLVKIEQSEEHGAVVSSRVIADELGRRRDDVLKSIDNILESQPEDLRSEIIPNEYTNTRGRQYREYLLTKDGFTLYMFNIQGHNETKLKYIKEFNRMEKELQKPLIERLKEDPETMSQIVEFVNDRLDIILQSSGRTEQQLTQLDNKIEGEYVSPQDIDAIKFATKTRAEKLMESKGLQITIDTLLLGDIYQQAQANKKAKEEYKYQLGKTKSKIMVAVKKHLGMKGNAPNNHIKRKDVDIAIQFIKSVKQSQLKY